VTPEQISLVQSSFERIAPRLADLTTRFYEELFRRDPALRPLFPADLAKQKTLFGQKLAEIVRALPRLGELIGHTRALGARHSGYGTRAADYQTFGGALLAALAAILGDGPGDGPRDGPGSGFDPATRQAWELAYNLVAETMLEGAAAAR
jgi:hemoglobin-like flavoprotein